MSERPLDRPLRIGILGAARIAPMALVRPAREVAGVEVAAVAARDSARAQKFATKHGISRVHATYDDLLNDPTLDAIYNPLPNALHCEWTVRALEAGKHVLCEKPLASNAAEAADMKAAADKAGRVLTEAFHWRYHPLATRVREILDSGELGPIVHVDVSTCVPFVIPGDIRYRYDLGGGASMDIGCYAVSILRFLGGSEPEVVSANARHASPDVDRWMQARYRFDSGATGQTTASLFSTQLLKLSARVTTERGFLNIFNPLAPHVFHRLKVSRDGVTTTESVPGDATYTCQLRAFERAVRGDEPAITDGSHGVANMRVIDEIYRKAGMKLRGE
jgi:predicted dehydrogenase